MDKIESFTIDHDKLLRGVYVSRKDKAGEEILTSFDIRLKEPNREPVIDMPALHTIEHLGAMFLRNHQQIKERVIYFGPMGCRTGCYAIFAGDLTSLSIIELIREMFKFIMEYDDVIPGTKPAECGNYSEHNLAMARYEAAKFYNEVLEDIKKENLEYPG